MHIYINALRSGRVWVVLVESYVDICFRECLGSCVVMTGTFKEPQVTIFWWNQTADVLDCWRKSVKAGHYIVEARRWLDETNWLRSVVFTPANESQHATRGWNDKTDKNIDIHLYFVWFDIFYFGETPPR